MLSPWYTRKSPALTLLRGWFGSLPDLCLRSQSPLGGARCVSSLKRRHIR
jgi:hypothetical protein